MCLHRGFQLTDRCVDEGTSIPEGRSVLVHEPVGVMPVKFTRDYLVSVVPGKLDMAHVVAVP